jgi:hypothetical protein
MAAGDLLRLGMHPSCEYPLDLGRDDLVLCADDIERRFVAHYCRPRKGTKRQQSDPSPAYPRQPWPFDFSRYAPGVQHGGEADARAEMLRVGGDGDERLGRGPKQEVGDDGRVVERDGADRRRQREDDVTIVDRQEFGPALGEPLPRRREVDDGDAFVDFQQRALAAVRLAEAKGAGA